jgi:hypothetical protein
MAMPPRGRRSLPQKRLLENRMLDAMGLFVIF